MTKTEPPLASGMLPPVVPDMARRENFYRHRLPVRIWHWLNVVALLVLLMSGLQIFNAHPALYWGQAGSELDTPVFDIGSDGQGDTLAGITSFGHHDFDTTGFLGVSRGPEGEIREIGFPSWATLPGFRDLATGRHWHFFFAWVFAINLVIYLIFSLVNGHLRRDLAPAKGELSPRHILHDIWDHARLRFPKGDAAKRYNILQKLAYLSVIAVALPLMILTGLTMSPGFNAIAPWMLTVFGGRQSARTLHFILANFLVLFVIVHLVMVVLAGVWNELRSMITGIYVIKHEPAGGKS
jgi:thiosulfate reductase cytochrome b subunit